jgi:hypothetical protein
MSRWTSVVSYHTDPQTCGVAKFSAHLAAHLGVPHVPLLDSLQWGDYPLFSLKAAELTGVPLRACLPHDQLWHDPPPLNYHPSGRVWKLYETGVPSLVRSRPIGTAPVLFTFGMSHKLDHDRFLELRALLPLHELWISTAEHEGAGPSKVPGLMAAWGPRARNLGHLTDDALALVWPRVHAFVAFFAGGLRANNTSVHAALDAGVPVVTNHGPRTPLDLAAVTYDYRTLAESGWFLPRPAGSPYTWERFLRELRCDPSTLPAA